MVLQSNGNKGYIGFPLRLFAGPPQDTTEPLRVSLIQSLGRVWTTESEESIEMKDFSNPQHYDHDQELSQEPANLEIGVQGRKRMEEAMDKALAYLTYGSEEALDGDSGQENRKYIEALGVEYVV